MKEMTEIGDVAKGHVAMKKLMMEKHPEFCNALKRGKLRADIIIMSRQ